MDAPTVTSTEARRNRAGRHESVDGVTAAPENRDVARDTKPIATLLGLLAAVVVFLVGALIAPIPQPWYELILVIVAIASFFTALCVRRRHGLWWWIGIGCSLLTMTMLIAELNPWIARGTWP